MSRVSIIEQLYAPKKKSALEFNYDALWAPPINFFLSQEDINGLYKIATSLKYNDDIQKKYELIDAIMKPRGFKRGNCGTNRVVYNFLEDTSFCMKIALDRVGINDSPREFKNQEYFKPFCCKIFEVDPTGVIACVERVNPISSIEEFASVADDIFNMMITKIVGKYVIDDLGTKKFTNYGVRQNSNGIAFGPVILDYPYAYELDGAKLHCGKPIRIGDKEYACGGEIDYDSGFNKLACCKCGRVYSARELAKDDSNVLKFYSDTEMNKARARIIRESDGTIVKDSGRTSNVYMTKEEYEEGNRLFRLESFEPRPVSKTHKNKYVPLKEMRAQYYTELQLKFYQEMQKKENESFNPVIRSESKPRIAKRAKNVKGYDLENNTQTSWTEDEYVIPAVRIAKRAENTGLNTEDVVDERKTEAVDDVNNIEVESTSNEEYDFTHELVEMLNEVINETSNNTEVDCGEEGDDKIISQPLRVTNHRKIKSYHSDTDEIIFEEDDSEYYQESDSGGNDVIITEMESLIFPEIANKNIIGLNAKQEEVDYSSYVPPEENDHDNDYYEDDDEYVDYYKSDHKNRDVRKQQNRNKKYIDDDMSEY